MEKEYEVPIVVYEAPLIVHAGVIECQPGSPDFDSVFNSEF